jgi:amino acid transporter
MNSLSRQQGSTAHIIIAIVLVVLLLGALGFIFWQNFINNPNPSQTESTTDVETGNDDQPNTYETAEYSFTHPESWTLVEETNVVDSSTYPSVQTADYAQTGMGLDAGAMVSVFISTTFGHETVDEYAEEMQKLPSVSDVHEITIDGIDAYQGRTDYEGLRWWTIAMKNGKVYNIQYDFAEGKEGVYRSGYDMIVESFRFTN